LTKGFFFSSDVGYIQVTKKKKKKKVKRIDETKKARLQSRRTLIVHAVPSGDHEANLAERPLCLDLNA
jgi:hypothetical protein